jgi:RNA polymerase sigma factor (sigma-70 family)
MNFVHGLVMFEPDREFEAILERVRAGEPGAFDELVEKYGPALRRAARAMLGRALRSQLDTLDLMQTVHRTMLTIIRDGKTSVGDSEQLCALALTLLRRKISRRWRTVKREPIAGSLDACETADPSPKPDETAIIKDELENLLQASDDLDRRVLKLRLLGYSTADAAQELHMDPAALRMRLSRLRNRLRENHSEDPPERQ